MTIKLPKNSHQVLLYDKEIKVIINALKYSADKNGDKNGVMEELENDLQMVLNGTL